MQRHMSKVAECVEELKLFFEAVLKRDWPKAETIQSSIAKLENDADDIKKEIRLQMPKGIFMPMSRVDLLEMLRIQDLVANKAKDVAGLMLGRHMDIPESLGRKFIQYLARCVDATEQARRAINELDELVETGFRGTEVELVQSMIKELDAIEKDSDNLQVELRSGLFTMEDSLPPIQVMFLYQVIDWIGEIADLSQRVGSRLEYLLAR